MTYVVGFFDWLQGLGVSVFMPLVILILGLIFGLGFSKSLKAGLTVGIGFVGLNLVINELLGTSLSPAVQTMVEKYNLALSVIDVGWPAAAAIALGSRIGVLIIPLGVAVNFIMLLTNTTQTLNVDIWNYWHFAFTGALTAIYTGSFAIGMIAAIINMIIIMVLADITAGKVEESLGIPGVSLPHGFSTSYAPIAMAFNWLIDKIPGVRDIDFNFENLREKIGILGEPMMIGTIIGVAIGIVAGYDLAGILGLGISLGAVLVLIPKMAAMLMEGLEPISEAAGEFIKKRFSNRGKMYIGLDSAIGVGHPVTLTVAYLLMPLALILAIVLPGNKVMPFTDLSVLPFMILLIAPIVNNNGFRTLLIGIIFLVFGLYISTDLAPLITQAAMDVGFQMPDGANMISCLSDGAGPLTWLLVNINHFGILGIAIASILAIILAIWNRKRIIKEASLLENN